MTYTKKFKTYSSRAEMEAAGWRFADEPRIADCRDCGQPVEWGATSPKGTKIPMNPHSAIIHFDTCGKPQTTPAPRPAAAAAPASQGDLKQSIDDLAVAIRAETSATLALLQELKSRRPPGTATPAATQRGRVDKDGCPC
jgi:hypothetical protein